ncbi:MAG TPA: tetratricopeptide repeat protein [Terriglobales bacterium]|jgi:tetratricopeptide (TPR) repeat protein|nr:tetratricopeptide repeat protein [Terriglobales bacterium]
MKHFLLVLICAGVLHAQTATLSDATQQHFAAAQAAQQNKDYVTAEREYRVVVASAPNFAEGHMNLGLVFQLQEKLPPAMAEFRRALQIKPKLTGANFFLGVDLCKSGQGLQAIPYLKAAALGSPQSADIWSWLATAQETSGQSQAEVATLKRGLESHPKNADLLYLLGRGYEKLGKEQVVSLQQSAPNSARSEQLLGESYATSSQWSLAVIHFQNALKLSPELTGLHVELGEVFLRAEKLKAAIDEFDAELKLHPQQLRAIVRSGEVKLINGDIDAALADWGRAIAIDKPQAELVLGMRETGFGDAALEQPPEAIREKLRPLTAMLEEKHTPASHFALAFIAAQEGGASAVGGEVAPTGNCAEAELGATLTQGRVSGLAPCAAGTANLPADLRDPLVAALVESGDCEAALKLLSTVPVAESRAPEPSYWRARCYEKMATTTYLQLYRTDPDSYRLHQLMADLESTRGDDVKAIEEYRAAIAAKPDLPNLHYSLGHLLWKGLVVPEARVELQAELAINPRHPGALHDLGNTYLSEYQAEKAKPYLEQAAASDPANLDIRRDLGTVYAQLHENAKAETEYKRAMPSDHDGAIHYKLGRLYQSEGRKEEAAREFAASEKLNRASHEKLETQTQRRGEIEHVQ